MNYPHPRMPPNFPAQYPPNFNPFAAQSSYQQFSSAPASYHGGPSMGHYRHGVFGGFAAANPSSPPLTYLAASGGSGSRADESSPVASASPLSGTQPMAANPASQIEEVSESSSDGNTKKGGRQLWSKDQEIRLVSAWLKNSKDPIKGNSKKYDSYWREVAAEYNKNSPMEDRRTTAQLKNHWTKTIPHINKFNGVYNEIKSAYASGQSDDQLMDKVREKYKSDYKKKRPFPLEHWWRLVKDEPKWGKTYGLEEMHKRARLNESGEYSSSTQDTEPRRPQGQKAAIAEKKGKGKANSQSSGGYFTDESMQLFNELQLRKSITAEKMVDATLAEVEAKKADAEARRAQAEATKAQVEAEKERAQAEMEKAKNQKVEKYLELLDKNTSDMDEVSKARHEQILAHLAKAIFS
ncbi:hypothetical protein EJB05_46170, partial [Eragrostis curvula]